MARPADLRGLLRLRAFDTGTDEGRSRERYRRAGLTAAAAVAAKMVGVATAVVTVPLTLNYLGVERYGLWITISSVSLMLGFADLGIGNGVLNTVSDANGQDDRELARRAVSSGFFLLSAICFAIILIFALLYSFVPWARVYNVSSVDAMREAGPATAVFVLVWAINIPLGIVQRVQLGYQKGFVNYAWQAAGSLLGLAGALMVIELELGLPWLVLALVGGPLVSVLLNGVVEFGWVRPWLRPAWRLCTRAVTRRILHLGVLFFVIQLSMTFSYFSDNIVIAQILGSAAVTQYAIPARLFGFIGIILGMVMAPLWPAYGEAVSRGDMPWVRRTLTRSLVLTFVFAAVPALALFVFGGLLIQVWVGDQVDPSVWLLGGLSVWTILSAVGASLAVFLNGASVLRFQTVCAVIMAAGAFALKIVFVDRWGVAGVPWAVAISYTVFIAVPMAIYVPRLLRQLAKRSREEDTGV
jgi:O-antigen/teichoic acid export membrane protein